MKKPKVNILFQGDNDEIRTLQADIPPVSGPVQTLLSARGDGPAFASIVDLQVAKSTMGRSTFCKVLGRMGKEPVEVEPHPESIDSPSGMPPSSGSAIGLTSSFNERGSRSFNSAMSYGATSLKIT